MAKDSKQDAEAQAIEEAIEREATEEVEEAEKRTRETQYREVGTIRLFAHKTVSESDIPNMVAGFKAWAESHELGIRNRASDSNGNLGYAGKSGIVSLALETKDSMERFLRTTGPSREVRDALKMLEEANALDGAKERAKASGLELEEWVKQQLDAAKRSALGL